MPLLVIRERTPLTTSRSAVTIVGFRPERYQYWRNRVSRSSMCRSCTSPHPSQVQSVSGELGRTASPGWMKSTGTMSPRLRTSVIGALQARQWDLVLMDAYRGFAELSAGSNWYV